MRLSVAITSHGFGHAAQVGPVINALRKSLPSLQLTVLSSLPASFLRGRIQGDFRLVKHSPDFGLIMKSALEIDLAASAETYAAVHRDWPARVEKQARLLREGAPDLVLADVPYLTLAAARYAGIPAVALCSLNWADIYRWYFSGCKESATVLAQMEEAYRNAAAFLCPEPSMPMSFLDNRVAIGPIAKRGTAQKHQLRDRLNIDSDDAMVLVAPGGVSTRFDMERWPRGQGIRWLVPDNWRVAHPDAVPIGKCGLCFTDLLASCDAVLGKCGYGTVTECVANGTPLLYIARPDWPEEQVLSDWLNSHHAGMEVEPQRLRSGAFDDLVRDVRSQTVRTCAANGAEQAATFLQPLLAGARCADR